VNAGHIPPRSHLPRLVSPRSQLFCPCFELGLVRRALQLCYPLPEVTFSMELFPFLVCLQKCEWLLPQKPSSHRKFWIHQTPENLQKENLGPALRMTVALDAIMICNNLSQIAANLNKCLCVIRKETKVKKVYCTAFPPSPGVPFPVFPTQCIIPYCCKPTDDTIKANLERFVDSCEGKQKDGLADF